MDIARILRRAVGALVLAAGLTIAAADSARADWKVARSERFEVYGGGLESEIVGMARELEAFHCLLVEITSARPTPVENRLKVYIVANSNQLREVSPGMGDTIGGFYVSSTGETAAVVLRDRGASAALSSKHILFHEYAHHFMLAHRAGAYPGWYIEGFAEYVATAVINPRIVEVGRIAPARISELANLPWTPMEDLLSKRQYQSRNPDTYYGLAWLLTHYMSAPERAPQFAQYLRLVGQGVDGAKAYTDVFKETPDALSQKLRAYVRGSIPYLQAASALGEDAPVRVERLPPSADALLLPSVRIAIGRDFPETGEGTTARAQFMNSIREKAARFPGDAFASQVLANAEINYGVPARAATALGDRTALAGDAMRLYLAGLARVKLAERDPAQERALTLEARQFFGDAHRADPNHYPTLYRYGQTFLSEGVVSENTLNVMLLAQQLAPQVAEIRLNTAHALVRRREYGEAIAMLQPLANDPHNVAAAASARSLIEVATEQQARPN